MLAALTIAAAIATSSPTEGQIGQCDPADGPGLRWTAETKAEARARAQAVLVDVGASERIRVLVDVFAWRESFGGAAGVRHRRVLKSGRRERGLGMHGLSLRWNRDKWPGTDEDPQFCRPEVSTLVVLEVLHRAMHLWGASNLSELQSVYAGRMQVIELEDGTRLRRPGSSYGTDLCTRLAARGVSCSATIRPRDLGRYVPPSEIRATADRLERSATSWSST